MSKERSNCSYGETKVIPTFCGSHCGGSCVIKAHVRDGVITKLETDDGIVLEVVREALSQAAGANQVTVRVSPADEPLVREAQQQLLTAAGPVDDLQILADEQVLRGGCLVETERGRFDARVDSQLRLLSDEVDRLLVDAEVRRAG